MDKKFAALVRKGEILMSTIGSHAYGMATPESDTDIRSVTLLPDPSYYIGLKNFEQWEDPDPDVDHVVFDLRKFVKLALSNNPNIFDVLWSPYVRAVSDWGCRLLDLRPALLSRLCAKTYGGYAQDQMRRFENDYHRNGSVRKWKHGAHLIRLLRMGCEILETGEVRVDRRGIDADELRSIRLGEFEFARVVGMADELDARLADAQGSTMLPQRPDRTAVERFMIEAVGSVF